MDTPLWGDHFYKMRTISEVWVNDVGTIVQAMLKLITLVHFDHLGCTIELQHTDMIIVHWFVHVVSKSKNILPFQLLLTYLAVQ
jgi:hypothetical protein